MTMLEVVLGILIGLVSGVLSGLFGVGGGIVMTPGLQVLMGAAPIVALATPLPVNRRDGSAPRSNASAASRSSSSRS